MRKLLAAIFLSLFLSSCGKKVEEKIIGKWSSEGGINLEFFSDKTFIDVSVKQKGQWVVLDDERIKLDVGSDIVVAQIKFDGDDQLLFRVDGRSEEILSRVEKLPTDAEYWRKKNKL